MRNHAIRIAALLLWLFFTGNCLWGQETAVEQADSVGQGSSLDITEVLIDGIPFISAKDITEDGEIIFDGVKQISDKSFNRLSRKICPKNGDIILSRIGTIGRVGLVRSNRKFLMSYSCCVIRIMNSKVDPTYLSYMLKSEMINKQILLLQRSIIINLEDGSTWIAIRNA